MPGDHKETKVEQKADTQYPKLAQEAKCLTSAPNAVQALRSYFSLWAQKDESLKVYVTK